MNNRNILTLEFNQNELISQKIYNLSSDTLFQLNYDELKQFSQETTLLRIEIRLGQGFYELKRENEIREYENSILKRIKAIFDTLISLDFLKNIEAIMFFNINPSFTTIDEIIPYFSEIPSMKVISLINPYISIHSIQLLSNYLCRGDCIVSSLTLEIPSVMLKNYDPKEQIIYKENHSISKLSIKSLLNNHNNDSMKIFNIISSFKNLTDVVLDLDQISNASKIYEVFSELTKISDKLTHLKLFAQNYIMEEGSFKMLEKLTNLKLLQISGQFTLNKIDLDLSRLKNLTHLKLNVTNSLQYLTEIQEIENLKVLHVITSDPIKKKNKLPLKLQVATLQNYKNLDNIFIDFQEFQSGCENQIIDNLNIISTICHQLNSLSIDFSNNLYLKKIVMSCSFVQKLGDFFSKCHFIQAISLNTQQCLMDDSRRYDLAYSLLKTQPNNDHSLLLYQGLSINNINLLTTLKSYISEATKTIYIPDDHRQYIYLIVILSQLKQYQNYIIKMSLALNQHLMKFSCKKSKQIEIFSAFKKYTIEYSGAYTFNNKETLQQIYVIDKFVSNDITYLNIKNKSITLHTILSLLKKYPKLTQLQFCPEQEPIFYDVDIPQFLKQCRKIQLKIRVKHLLQLNILKLFELEGFNIKINLHPYNLKKIDNQELFNKIIQSHNLIQIYRIYNNKNRRYFENDYNLVATQSQLLINEHCKMVNQQILILIPYYRLISEEQIIHPCQLYIDLLLD